jgi:tRNA A37 methylthiotransferase MiaB
MEFYKKQEGVIAKVLFEKVKDGLITGYTENYTRVILRDENVNLENQILKVELGKAIPEFIECKRVLESRII